MPLIIISGYPCCGKTSYCKQLETYLRSQGAEKVIIINEESENINKRLGYREAFDEKKTRGALKSAVDHALDAESFVILDSMNYIKGYRYELFCISRSLRTPHCCVWVENDDILSVKWNESRKAVNNDNGYDSEILLDLRRRFEAPIEKNRWDFPLFRVTVAPIAPIMDPVSTVNTVSSVTNDLKGCNLGTNNTTSIGDLSGNTAAVETTATTAPSTEHSTAVSTEYSTAVSTKHSTEQSKKKPQMIKVVPLTSTKGMIDINCFAADKVPTVGFRSETVFDKVTAPVTSSWRPNIRSDGSVNTARTFTSLAGDNAKTNGATYVSASSSGTFNPHAALSISGSFPIIAPDDQSQSPELIMHQIYLHLTNTGQVAAPNSSTISVPRVNADLLHELDRTSQNITQRITTHQAENAEGTPLIFQDFDRTLALHRHVGLAELQRHRRHFVKTNSNMAHSSISVLGSLFIDSLALNL